MILSILVALDERGGIGLKNALPWHLSADLKRFKQLTTGHHLVMGRKTWEAIARPLPGRQMIVITRQREYQAPGCTVTASLRSALELADERGETETFVVGGAEIYRQALPLAHRLYLTRVHALVEADTFFPPFDLNEWVELERIHHPQDQGNEYPTTFLILERIPEG